MTDRTLAEELQQLDSEWAQVESLLDEALRTRWFVENPPERGPCLWRFWTLGGLGVSLSEHRSGLPDITVHVDEAFPHGTSEGPDAYLYGVGRDVDSAIRLIDLLSVVALFQNEGEAGDDQETQ